MRAFLTRRATNRLAAGFVRRACGRGGLLLVALSLVSDGRGDGVVTSLTEADLRSALASGGNVTFATSGTIALAAPIAVTTNTTLSGAGFTVTISGGGSSSLFHVVSNLTLVNLTLSQGRATNGGALSIEPAAALVATNCIFSLNQALGTNGNAGANGSDTTGIGGNGTSGRSGKPAFGGAIFNQGQLTLLACQFLTNRASGGNGGIGGDGGDGDFQGGNGGSGGSGGAAFGGAVYSRGAIIASNCTFIGNSVRGGTAAAGGIAGTGPFPGLHGSGGAGGACGGAAVYAVSNALVINSTFVANSGQGGDSAAGGENPSGTGANGAAGGDAAGGGLWSGGVGNVTNCTFSSNSVSGGSGGDGGDGSVMGGDGGGGGYGSGGGICNAGTLLHVVNCTMVGGSSLGGFGGTNGVGPFPGNPGADAGTRGGNIANNGGTLMLKNSILAYPVSGTNSYVWTNVVSTVTNYSFNVLIVSTNTFGLVNGQCGDSGLPPACYTNIVFTNGSTVSSNLFFLTNCAPLNLPTNCLTNIVFTNVVTSNYSETIWVTNIINTTNVAASLNAYGTILDAGNNLSSDASPTFGSNSRNLMDPKLGPLEHNGGPTLTFKPEADSPAMDAGDDAVGLAFDQRGAPRPGGAHSDIGAVESWSSVPPVLLWPAANGPNFTFAFMAESGVQYVTEFKSDLSDTVWLPLQTNTGTGSAHTNSTPLSSAAHRFFRVRVR